MPIHRYPEQETQSSTNRNIGTVYPLGDQEGFFIGSYIHMNTKIKNWVGVFVVGLLVIFGIAGFLLRQNPQTESAAKQSREQATAQKPVVSVTLNKNGDIATYSGIIAQTPYEALVAVTQKERIPVVTKQYDFGVFVQKVADLETGSDMAWIVSVNGISLNVAADKETVKTGDMVEWAYTKAIY